MASLDVILSKKRKTKALIRLIADAQAGLRLCCSQTSEDRFSHDEAQLKHNILKSILQQNGDECIKHFSTFDCLIMPLQLEFGSYISE